MIELKLSIPTIIYIVIAIILLMLTIYPREKQSGYLGDWSQLSNYFWGIVFIVFTLIYGGVFFW